MRKGLNSFDEKKKEENIFQIQSIFQKGTRTKGEYQEADDKAKRKWAAARKEEESTKQKNQHIQERKQVSLYYK